VSGHAPARLRVFEPLERLQPDGFVYRRWRGHVYPPFIDPAQAQHLMDAWETDEHDVFICTHQKVGTHLAKKFAVEVLRALHDYPPAHPLHEGDIGHGAVPWPEVSVSQHGYEHFQQFLDATAGRPRVWYLHCPAGMLPMRRIHPRSRFVMVYRDPRAVAVSQFFFYKAHPLLQVPADLTLDRFVSLFVEGHLYFGDYHQHTLEWLDGCGGRIASDQMLALRYEELVERKADVVDAMARHLGRGASLPAARRDAVAASTEFATMKEGITANPRTFHFNPATFFRAGRTDDWMNHLSADHVAAIDAKTMRVWGAGSLSSPPSPRCRTLETA
jgi:hypothetical protein